MERNLRNDLASGTISFSLLKVTQRNIRKNMLPSSPYNLLHIGSLLGLFFNPDDDDDMFL
jgi:hypothetical protein